MLDSPKRKVEAMPERKARIIEQNGKFSASLDGIHGVPVQTELGENIALALRVQEKVDEALMAGHRPGFLQTVRMLNCRKAISAVRGTVPLSELVTRQMLKQEIVSVEDLEEVSGVAELKKDIGHILDSGRTPVLGSKEDMHIASYLDENLGELPAIVHVFDLVPKYEGEILSQLINHSKSFSVDEWMQRMHRNHTFLVLGKDVDGKYICFQKQGPEIHHRFELRELGSLIDLTVAPLQDRTELSFIGPLILGGEDSETEGAAKETA